jgi:hypothetical protein
LGVLLGSFSITGNIIGEIPNSNLIGSLLIILGILGLIVSKR